MNGQVKPATPNDSVGRSAIAASIDQISLAVYEAIVLVQSQHSDWVVEKYRKAAFHRHRSSLLNRLHSVLGQAIDRETLLAKLKQFLQALLIPKFFNSVAYRDLLEQVDGAVAPQSHRLLSPALDPRVENSETDSRIAVLLLDAENLKLNAKTESLLASWCNYPLHVKIAFANWRSMGRWDIEFHQRGYQMIHVPQGKNSADMEMTAVGSSILAQHPTVKEVIVGATDRDLNHLKNRLQTQGLVVYSVTKHGKSVTILNHQTGKSETYANDGEPEPIEIPTLNDFLDTLKGIIQTEQVATNSSWVRLARLSQLFFQQHNLTIKQVITALGKGDRSVKDFLSDYPTNFVIHQPLKYAGLYISLFQETPKVVESSTEPTAPAATNLPNAADRPAAPEAHHPSQLPEFNSSEMLSDYLAMLLQETIKTSGKEYVSIGELGSIFRKNYGKSITTVIKEVNRTGGYVKYLETETAFKLKRVKELWFVTVSRR